MNLKDSIVDKLRPGRMKVSAMFHAILAHVLGERWAEPAIIGIAVAEPNIVMLMHEGEIGYNHVLGHTSDLRNNFQGVAKAAGLSAEETDHLMKMLDAKIGSR